MIKKPDWSKAPDWANYLAQDGCGLWYWFEVEPYPNPDHGMDWEPRQFTKCLSAHPEHTFELGPMERRP